MHGCALDKLMAIATYRAEVDRTRPGERDIDLDELMANRDSQQCFQLCYTGC